MGEDTNLQLSSDTVLPHHPEMSLTSKQAWQIKATFQRGLCHPHPLVRGSGSDRLSTLGLGWPQLISQNSRQDQEAQRRTRGEEPWEQHSGPHQGQAMSETWWPALACQCDKIHFPWSASQTVQTQNSYHPLFFVISVFRFLTFKVLSNGRL